MLAEENDVINDGIACKGCGAVLLNLERTVGVVLRLGILIVGSTVIRSNNESLFERRERICSTYR